MENQSNKDIYRHQEEINKNFSCWENKPVLQIIYTDFYKLIKQQLNIKDEGITLELGSGPGNIKTVIPNAICSDLFDNPWIDKVENAYKLSFDNQSILNIILFDVFHHLEYPGTVLQELYRVIKPGGRVIIFDPAMSLTGLIVYGLFHHEPLGIYKKIKWNMPEGYNPWHTPYYAAQSNVQKVFFSKRYRKKIGMWNIKHIRKLPYIAYVLSGGYSKPLLLPEKYYSLIRKHESVLECMPGLFGTRALVVLEKPFTV